jgi:hypothetical protein
MICFVAQKIGCVHFLVMDVIKFFLTADNLFQVRVEDDRYWGIVFHHNYNWDQLR